MRPIETAQKIVLITGASSGIGAELTKRFAQDGYSLVLVARDKDKLEAFAKDIQRMYNVRIKSFASDLSKRKSSEEIFIELHKHGLEVDILVNNAGVFVEGAFAEKDFVEYADLLNINVLAPLYLTYLLLPQMIERNSGKILNVASVAAFRPGPFKSVYAASKGFVFSWSQALHKELKKSNISVTVVCPDTSKTLDEKKLVADRAYAGLMKNKNIVLIGFKNKLLGFLRFFQW